MLQIALIFSIGVAVLALQTQKLRQSIIYLSVYSIIISFVYSLYHAPDVAMAEAIIGSAFSTILYIVTLQKYLIFTIYVPIGGISVDDELFALGEKSQLIKTIEVFCAKEELEPQVIFTTETMARITDQHDYSVIIRLAGPNKYDIYAHPENYKQEKLQRYLTDNLPDQYHLAFKHVGEVL